MIRVLIDSVAIQNARTERVTTKCANVATKNQHGEVTGLKVSEISIVSPLDYCKESEDFNIKEIPLLKEIADLAKAGKIELLEDRETALEIMGLKNYYNISGKLYDAPINRAESPVPRAIVIGSPWMKESSKEKALEFLLSVEDKRFLELQKITNARISYKKITNQMRDAYFIWSAEHNKCDFFLTFDKRLINMARTNHDRIKAWPAPPSVIIERIKNGY